MVVLDFTVDAAEVLVARRQLHGGVYLYLGVVEHGGEDDSLEGRAGLIDVAHGDVAVAHLHIVVQGGVDGQVDAYQHIARAHLHQHGTTRRAAIHVEGFAERRFGDVLVAGVYSRDNAQTVNATLQHYSVHRGGVGALSHFLTGIGLVGQPDTFGEAAAVEQTVLTTQYAVVVSFEACVRTTLLAVAEAYGVACHIAIYVGPDLMHHTLAIDLAHHSAAPARQTCYLQPHRIRHISLHQEATTRTLFVALGGNTVAVVDGRASRHSVGKHQTQGVEVAAEVAVDHRATLHGVALLVVLHVAVLVELLAVV